MVPCSIWMPPVASGPVFTVSSPMRTGLLWAKAGTGTAASAALIRNGRRVSRWAMASSLIPGGPARASRSVAARDLRRLAGEAHDVQPRASAVGQVDEAALVGLDVVRLDRHLAAPRAVRHAALGRPLRGRRDVE